MISGLLDKFLSLRTEIIEKQGIGTRLKDKYGKFISELFQIKSKVNEDEILDWYLLTIEVLAFSNRFELYSFSQSEDMFRPVLREFEIVLDDCQLSTQSYYDLWHVFTEIGHHYNISGKYAEAQKNWVVAITFSNFYYYSLLIEFGPIEAVNHLRDLDEDSELAKLLNQVLSYQHSVIHDKEEVNPEENTQILKELYFQICQRKNLIFRIEDWERGQINAEELISKINADSFEELSKNIPDEAFYLEVFYAPNWIDLREPIDDSMLLLPGVDLGVYAFAFDKSGQITFAYLGQVDEWQTVKEAVESQPMSFEEFYERYKADGSLKEKAAIKDFFEEDFEYKSWIYTHIFLNENRKNWVSFMEKELEGWFQTADKQILNDIWIYSLYLSNIFETFRNKKELFFSADGAFNIFPLQLLPFENGYVNDYFSVCQVANIHDLIVESSDKRIEELSAIILAAPDYGKKDNSDLPYLYAAKYEGDLLAETMEKSGVSKVTSLIQEKATKENLLNAITNKHFDFLHFATHGLSEDGKLKMALAGANLSHENWLCEEDFLNFNLSGSIVVLSLCEAGKMSTALQDSMSGFIKSVLLAGAKTVICPIYPISDLASLVIFHHFYNFLLNKQMLPHLALTEAINTMRSITNKDLKDFEAKVEQMEKRASRKRGDKENFIEFDFIDDEIDSDSLNEYESHPLEASRYWGSWLCYEKN